MQNKCKQQTTLKKSLDIKVSKCYAQEQHKTKVNKCYL